MFLRFGQELVPFGRTILELFQKILQWTSTDLENQITFNNSKPFKSVKIQAYKCLCSWLINTNSLSGIETIANECLIFILKDITPERERILLTVSFRYELNNVYHYKFNTLKNYKRNLYIIYKL